MHWDAPARSADGIATDQILDAGRLVARPESAFLSFPWPAIAHLVGSIPPASVSFVGAFSGGGKTTFVSSLVTELLGLGKKIYVMALETTPDHFRTYLACQQLGIRPGDILSGESYRMPNGMALRDAVHSQIERQFEDSWRNTLRVSNEETINYNRLERAFEEAFEWGADMVLVDHYDEIDPDNPKDIFSESVRTVKGSGRLARKYGLKVFGTSQLNNDAAKGNKLSKYQPPQVPHFYMGGHKIHVAHNVIGLFRPLRARRRTETVDEYRETLAAAKAGDIEPQHVLEPGRMGVNLVKSKFYGEREGGRCYVSVSNGRVLDEPMQSIEERYGI